MNIDIHVFEKMISIVDNSERNHILFNINQLLEYSAFVSKLEENVKRYSNSTFMIKKLDEDRREKHDTAISCIIELNEISRKLHLENFYNGDINDENRDVIARAIYEFSKYYLNK